MENGTVDTLEDFAKIVAKFGEERDRVNPILWRGHAEASWDFEPTAVRRLKSSDFGGLDTGLEEDVKSYEEELLDDARSRGLDRSGKHELSEMQLLARVRHFGGATRFMDFTRNPMTALWFACQDKVEEVGTVYALDTFGCVRVTPNLVERGIGHLTESENYKNVLYYWRPRYVSDRMHAQQSVLVFSRLEEGGWSPLQVNGPDSGVESKRVYEIRISDGFKDAMRDSWDQLFGYSHIAMFPDIEGFGTHHSTDEPINFSHFSI